MTKSSNQNALFPEDAAPAVNASRLASVLVPYPVNRAYSYAVPDGMDVAPGDYVIVPLGNREVPGIVWDDPVDDVPSKKLKSIVTPCDLPPLPAVHRRFVDWLAHYTMSPKGFVMKMVMSVPAALEPPKPVTGYVLSEWAASILASSPPPLRGEEGRGVVAHARSMRSNPTEAERTLWHHLNREQLGVKFRRQHPVGEYIADFACIEKNLILEVDGGQHSEEADADRTAFLEAQGFRVLRFWNNDVLGNIEGVLQTIAQTLAAFPPPRPSPREAGGGGEAERARARLLNNLSPQRRRVLDVLIDGLPRRAAEIADQAGCTPAVVKGLLTTGLLEAVDIFSSAPCRRPDPYREGPPLSGAQAAAAKHMCEAVKKGGYHAALLDGVTGAGKTEVYFEAVAEALKKGQQVLLMLPEIALSNAFLARFRDRFGCSPALWHSNLTPAQRRTAWRGVAEGHTKVVVGARSALFLPYQDLGLIIVDEEHDPAYKQEDGVIYHARDMAVVRAHLAKIPILLVSATPSLETMANAWAGRYEHLHLPDRHGGARLPDMHIIDMKIDKPERQHFISPVLRAAIEQTLEAGEQALLFLNRRGYAPLTLCRTCGHRIDCPRCTAWLVEHKRSGRLHCHHCGFNMQFPKTCTSCGDTDSLAPCGPGVERVLEEVKTYFPDARIVVLASDTAETQDELKAILKDIREQKYDIIIGTQIIAKGHHFPRLTCVGVVDADLGLNGGDLRAAERTYQLLHQVAGRAGREELPGRVYLQTFFPDNKVMQALASHERDYFMDVEAGERERAHMPPFSRLAGIIVAGKDERQVMEVAAALGKVAPHGEGIQTLGPAEAAFYRLRGYYRRRLLVRADKELNIQQAIDGWLAQVKVPSTVRVYVDIDPQSFL